MRDLIRRLERLETPTREQYEVAFRRAKLRGVRQLGALLAGEGAALLGGGSEARDAETLLRYRATLAGKGAKKEGDALLSAAYGKAERRGVDVWEDADFGELADELEARGIDASGVRYFSE